MLAAEAVGLVRAGSEAGVQLVPVAAELISPETGVGPRLCGFGQGDAVRLSILYRTHPGENRKRRPPWYSRRLALLSLRQALERADVEQAFTFVADGGIPEDLLPLVRPTDGVARISGGSAASSMRRAVDVALVAAEHDPAATFYWLAEDDYLYRPNAVEALLTAIEHFTEVTYFTLYKPDDSAWFDTHKSQPAAPVPPLTEAQPARDDVRWQRVSHTTSTLGLWRDTLLEDAQLLKLGTTPGSPFDAATWHALQGIPPYPWRYLVHDLDGYWRPRGIAKVVGKPPMRAVVNLAARRRGAGDRRVLIAPTSDLAMHLETDVIPAGTTWEECARECLALARGGDQATGSG